jgi:hypothetical protein
MKAGLGVVQTPRNSLLMGSPLRIAVDLEFSFLICFWERGRGGYKSLTIILNTHVRQADARGGGGEFLEAIFETKLWQGQQNLAPT